MHVAVGMICPESRACQQPGLMQMQTQLLKFVCSSKVTDLVCMQALDLSNNGFTGGISPFWINSRNLRLIDLSWNNLT